MKLIHPRKLKAGAYLQMATLPVNLLGLAIALLGVIYQFERYSQGELALTDFIWQTVLITVVISVVVYSINALLFRRLIEKPVNAVRRQAELIVQDETRLGEQITEPVGEELRGLTRSFNLLSARLKKYTDEVESKVIERTRLLEEGSRLVQEVLDTTPNLLCLMNTEIDQFNYVNREFSSFFGVENEEMLGLGPNFFRGLIHPDDREHFATYEAALMLASDEDVLHDEFRMNSGGDWRWVGMRSVVFQRNRDLKPKLVLHVGQDISDLKQTEEKLRFLSIHDQLTGLYNRLYFEEEMSRLDRGRVFPISLIMADLDNLKIINDTYGHAVGDEVLRAASQVLRASFRAEDVVARIGGDEFAALLPGATEQATRHVVDRILDRVQKHPAIHSDIVLSISLGMATIQKGGGLADGLKSADEHMYQVKQLKKLAVAE